MKKPKKVSNRQNKKSDKEAKSKDPSSLERDGPYKGLQGEDLAAARRVGWDKSADREW